jgi:membrane fusion protein, multidrug efflux system
MVSTCRQIFGLGVAAAILSLSGCSAKTEKTVTASTGPKPVPVTITPVTRRPVERSIDVVGSLKGWVEVTIGSKRAGRVLKVFHDMGDRVKPGEHLIELETIDAELNVLKAERTLQADLAKLGLSTLPGREFDPNKVPSVVQAQVAVERAKQELARQRNLHMRNAGTLQDLQNAENNEQGQEAALDNAVVTARSTLAMALADKVALDTAIQARKDLEIFAPVPSKKPEGEDGPIEYAIARKTVHEGQWLKEGEAIFDLVIVSPLKIWTNVPERYSSDVKIGQPARLLVASHPGQTFEGRVARINPTVDPQSRTFQVETVLPNPNGILHPGGFAKVSILTRRDSEALVVPLESIVRYAGVTKVFVAQGEKAREVQVETSLEGRDWVEVIGPLSLNDRVVTTGQSQLADGTTIVIRDPEADAPAPASKKTADDSVAKKADQR